MGSLINENIRYYKSSDPYYYEVDNLPLQDLVENDKVLEEAILAIAPWGGGSSGGGAGRTVLQRLRDFAKRAKSKLVKLRALKGPAMSVVGREGFDDLLPYVSGDDGRVYVTQGSFISRTGNAPLSNMGLKEYNGPRQADGTDNQTAIKAAQSSLNYPARMETFYFPTLGTGEDQSVLISTFDADDFVAAAGDTRTALARYDLLFVAGTDAPVLGVVKGAGILGGEVGNRFAGADGDIQSNNYDSDPAAPENAASVGKHPFESGAYQMGAYPLPDDLYNRAEEIINGAISSSDDDASFCIPLCYILVPAGHQEGNTVVDQQIADVRPFFRSTELTLDERQALAVAEPKIDITNPVASQINVDALDSRLAGLETSFGGIETPGDWSLFGRLGLTYAGRANDTTSEDVNLEPGTYVCVFLTQCDWGNGTKTVTYQVENSAGSIMQGAYTPEAKVSLTGNADDFGWMTIPISLTVSTTSTVRARHIPPTDAYSYTHCAYFLRIN